ncbi:hypothetical protein QTP88_016459 [Uroleucon formosanum]
MALQRYHLRMGSQLSVAFTTIYLTLGEILVTPLWRSVLYIASIVFPRVETVRLTFDIWLVAATAFFVFFVRSKCARREVNWTGGCDLLPTERFECELLVSVSDLLLHYQLDSCTDNRVCKLQKFPETLVSISTSCGHDRWTTMARGRNAVGCLPKTTR